MGDWDDVGHNIVSRFLMIADELLGVGDRVRNKDDAGHKINKLTKEADGLL